MLLFYSMLELQCYCFTRCLNCNAIVLLDALFNEIFNELQCYLHTLADSRFLQCYCFIAIAMNCNAIVLLDALFNEIFNELQCYSHTLADSRFHAVIRVSPLNHVTG